jgi:hypothetical protein
VPGDDIVTDPAASALYNSRLEGWGDRLRAGGVRLCKFFKAQGMPVDCK